MENNRDNDLEEATIVVSRVSSVNEETITNTDPMNEETVTGDRSKETSVTNTFTEGSGYTPDLPLPPSEIPKLEVVVEQDAVLQVETFVDPEKANEDLRIRPLEKDKDEFIERIKENRPEVRQTTNVLHDASRLLDQSQKRAASQSAGVIIAVVIGALLIGATIAVLVNLN